MESVAYVGMDVDKEKIAVAVVCDYEPQARQRQVVANRPKAVKRLFEQLNEHYETVIACYEAGACGFELYRRITDVGAGCVVAAPATVPKKPTDRVKTDRRDAVKLALGLRNGELTPVYVPSRDDEATRDYLRLYEDVKDELKRAKQRLQHFLHRRELRWTGAHNWTAAHRRWLRSLEFENALEQHTFDEYLSEVLRLEEKRARIAAEVEEIAAQERYCESVATLRAFKGIGTLTALSLVVEIGDFRRFRTAAQFMAFLGLVPCENSSGDRRRLGGITKAGNSHLRKLLVEAAWHARSYHRHSRSLRRDRSGLPAQTVAYADRAGRRLTKKFHRLLYSGRPPQVAATAVARELAGFLWGAMLGQTA